MRPTRPRVRPVDTFLVERYWPGVTLEAFTSAAERLGDSVDQLRREGTAIRAVASTLVPSDEAAYWIVDATSIDLVQIACQRAGMRVERIVPAIELRASRELRAVGPGRRAGDVAGHGDAAVAATSTSRSTGDGGKSR
jgi:methylaspartate ammonia-lyase